MMVRTRNILAGIFVVGLVPFAACTNADSPGADESDLTAACRSASVDPSGFCRARNGRFAKASCCAPVSVCSTAELDDHGVCRRGDNGQFAPTSCCAALCEGTQLDGHGYCRSADGRFAASSCCNNGCASAQAGGDDVNALAACGGTSIPVSDAVGTLEGVFDGGMHDDAKVSSTEPLEMIKEYLADPDQYGADASEFEIIENATQWETDVQKAGTISKEMAIDAVHEAIDGWMLDWLNGEDGAEDKVARWHGEAKTALDALIEQGVVFGFDGFAQMGCAAPTTKLLVIDPKSKMVFGIDMNPCSES